MNSAYSALQSCACCCHFAQQTGMLLRLAVAFPAFSWLLLPELGMGGQGPISSCRSAALSSSTPWALLSKESFVGRGETTKNTALFSLQMPFADGVL